MKEKSSEILAQKSRELLADQLNSVDTNNSKAGTFIAISSLFIPISFGIIDKMDVSTLWLFIFFIPIGLNLLGLFFLVQALFPKKLFHGMNFNEFDRLINEDKNEVYLFEIAANRDSYRDNKNVLKKQNKDLKNGLLTIYLSAVILALLLLLNNLITNCNCYG
jgi:hypothetical protein